MELQTLDSYKRDLNWITDDLKVAGDRAEYLYFIGCQPYFNILFRDINVDTLTTARAAIKILNQLGITPLVSDTERCCGHDLYWSGDIKLFKKLVNYNLKLIRSSGVKKVVFSCPECYAIFKLIYPQFSSKLKFEAIYLMELIYEKLNTGNITLAPQKLKVTYQDPCRLSRFTGIIDTPRKILTGIPELEFYEMTRTGVNSVCCGSSGWYNCSAVNKKIQLERLEEARSTAADTVITACPKCQIHLNCALNDEDCTTKIQIKDFYTLLSDSLGGEPVG